MLILKTFCYLWMLDMLNVASFQQGPTGKTLNMKYSKLT